MTTHSYANPPIQEALVEFRFADDSGWEWTLPGRFWNLMATSYDGPPRSEQVITIAAKHQFRQISTRAAGGVGRVFLTRKDETGLIGLAPNVLSVHVMRPYPGWAHLLPRIAEVLEKYPEVQPDPRVVRVGLRSVNRIIIPESSVQLDEWFNGAPTLPAGVGTAISALMSRLETRFNDGAHMSVTLATVSHDDPDSSAYLLDIDLGWAPAEPVALDKQLIGLLERLHTREGTAFEAMITDRTRGLFT